MASTTSLCEPVSFHSVFTEPMSSRGGKCRKVCESSKITNSFCMNRLTFSENEWVMPLPVERCAPADPSGGAIMAKHAKPGRPARTFECIQPRHHDTAFGRGASSSGRQTARRESHDTMCSSSGCNWYPSMTPVQRGPGRNARHGCRHPEGALIGSPHRLASASSALPETRQARARCMVSEAPAKPLQFHQTSQRSRNGNADPHDKQPLRPAWSGLRTQQPSTTSSQRMRRLPRTSSSPTRRSGRTPRRPSCAKRSARTRTGPKWWISSTARLRG